MSTITCQEDLDGMLPAEIVAEVERLTSDRARLASDIVAAQRREAEAYRLRAVAVEAVDRLTTERDQLAAIVGVECPIGDLSLVESLRVASAHAGQYAEEMQAERNAARAWSTRWKERAKTYRHGSTMLLVAVCEWQGTANEIRTALGAPDGLDIVKAAEQVRAERDRLRDDLAAERERNQPLRQRIKEAQDRADRAVKEAQRAAWEHWSNIFRPLNEAMATERKLEAVEAENGRLREALERGAYVPSAKGLVCRYCHAFDSGTYPRGRDVYEVHHKADCVLAAAQPPAAGTEDCPLVAIRRATGEES